jgi:Cft2 family RNA processing exonuclease
VVTIDEKNYTVKATVKKFNLSAHTDRAGIGSVIAKVKPRHLVLIHGSKDALHDLARSDLQKHYTEWDSRLILATSVNFR